MFAKIKVNQQFDQNKIKIMLTIHIELLYLVGVLCQCGRREEATLALSRSIAFMRLPWKYLTLVCCLFNKPSNSRSGSALESYKSQGLVFYYWTPGSSVELEPMINFEDRIVSFFVVKHRNFVPHFKKDFGPAK